MTQYCIECGKELLNGAKFCQSCGAKTDIRVNENVIQKKTEDVNQSKSPALVDFKAAPLVTFAL